MLDLLRSGAVVALVGDAGTPLLADPGERLVRASVEAGFRVSALPGAQALLPALTASGLPVTPFHFEGFLPRRPSERAACLEKLADEEATVVLYESPDRLVATLADLAVRLGDRQAVVARELTKLHETYHRGTFSSLEAAFTSTPPKGECVIIIAGKRREKVKTGVDAWVAERLEAGRSPAEIRREAPERGFTKNAAYRLALERRGRSREPRT